MIFMKAFIVIIISLLFVSLAFAAQNKTDEKTNVTRGRGLEEAIRNVPEFVAEKLNYMRELFASGIKGIGQALSDWIHSFFKPVIKGNQTNKTV